MTALAKTIISGQEVIGTRDGTPNLGIQQERRQLQQQPDNENNNKNNNNNSENNNDKVPVPSLSPIMTRPPVPSTADSPTITTITKPPTVSRPSLTATTAPTETPPVHRTFVTVEWSMIHTINSTTTTATLSSSYKTEIMEQWLLKDFLCAHNKVWMANSMDLLRNACPDHEYSKEDIINIHVLLDSYSIILWNEPYVYWYSEMIEDVHYDVWNAQYPIFTIMNWNTNDKNDDQEEEEEVTNNEEAARNKQLLAQEKLQTMLDDQIQRGQLQFPSGDDNGVNDDNLLDGMIVSIVGKELETWWLHKIRDQGPKFPKFPTLPPGYNDPQQRTQPPPQPKLSSSTLPPYSAEPLVITGAIIILVHTLIMLFLHFVLRPCLKKRMKEQARRKTMLLLEHHHHQSSSPIINHRESSQKSIDSDHMRSFLAPNYWLNGGKQQQQHPPTLPTLFVRSTSLGVAQMPSDEDNSLLSLGYVSALDSSSSHKSYFSVEEEDIEVFSLLGSSGMTRDEADEEGGCTNNTGDFFVTITPSASASRTTTTTTTEEPEGLHFVAEKKTSTAGALMAPIASFFGRHKNNNNNNDQATNASGDDSSFQVLEC